jgi:HNH endonuclease
MSDERVTSEQRAAVIERAYGCCEYCWSQARFATQAFSVEHILPRSKGGTTTLENLALSCQGCNNHKYNHTNAHDSVSGQTVPLYHPRQHQWRDHFTWNDDYTLLIGLAPIGRATVELLRLNREGVINLRRVLYSIGEHPAKMSAEQETE